MQADAAAKMQDLQDRIVATYQQDVRQFETIQTRLITSRSVDYVRPIGRRNSLYLTP